MGYMNNAYGELGTTDDKDVPIPGPSPGPGPSPTPSPPYECGSSEACHCSPGMNNGNNMESSARRASTADECCNLCQAEERCVGWTWIQQSGNECWLKDQISDSLRQDDYVVSGKVTGKGPVPSPTPTPTPSRVP